MKRPIIGWAIKMNGFTTIQMGPEEPPTPPGGEVVRILSVKEAPHEVASAVASPVICEGACQI